MTLLIIICSVVWFKSTWPDLPLIPPISKLKGLLVLKFLFYTLFLLAYSVSLGSTHMLPSFTSLIYYLSCSRWVLMLSYVIVLCILLGDVVGSISKCMLSSVRLF